MEYVLQTDNLTKCYKSELPIKLLLKQDSKGY